MLSRVQHLLLTALIVLMAFTRGGATTEAPPPVPDVLVYNDGDRVQGRLVRREGDAWIFNSPRFGELRVAIADASVVTAGASPDALPGPAETRPAPAVATTSTGSPVKLTQTLRDFFGPWSGRFMTSVQLARDVSERTDFMVETALNRTWTSDEINLTARYDFNRTNEVNTTNIFRGGGMWRHTLPRRLFTLYRPSYEWHRGSTPDGVSHNYILLQQEIGLGVTLVDRETWKLRTGVAENFFNNWDLRTDSEHSARVESVFLETNIQLPWRIVVTERAVYYYSFQSGGDGWEHQFEVTKKLTDTLSLGLRHEARYNAPDVRSTDYSLLRLLLGFDF